ncbi:hypothetical protein QFC24_003476 [Naganishia onofrii]|uniref:Uncharacterized protein n=1 Tax=Naganishia onofrii TaxID=1851511 RepID=A0ACC2XK82_9TREE|nr:hypothetical protein QFC24_003476 [Naganishia onofrii]
MSDVSASLEPFLLVARSTKGAAAAKVIMDATSGPGVYGFGELLDMPNIKQLQTHESLSSHYKLLQLFAYGTYQSYEADRASYPALNKAQLEKLKQLSLVSLGMESRSLAYSSLLPVLDQPSIRALEDLIIDSIYAGIISGRMDQASARFSVDWVLGRDLDVGGSGLRDLGMRLENWYVADSIQVPWSPMQTTFVSKMLSGTSVRCEMTENLLSSLDIKIAQSRAETIATKALADHQEQERFAAYHAFSLTGKVKGNKGDKQQRQQQNQPPQSGATFNGNNASGSNLQDQTAPLGQGNNEQNLMAEIDPSMILGTGRNTRSQGRKPQTRSNIQGDASANGATSYQDNDEGTNDAPEGSANGATRIRL